MSIKVMTLVWEKFPASGSELLAMLALADWCSDDGSSLYPSMQAVGSKIRVGEKQARRIVQGFVNDGYLAVVGNEYGGKPGTTKQFRLNVQKLANLPELNPKKPKTAPLRVTPPLDVTPPLGVRDPSHPCPSTPPLGGSLTVIEPSIEPLVVIPHVAVPQPQAAATTLASESKFVPLAAIATTAVNQRSEQPFDNEAVLRSSDSAASSDSPRKSAVPTLDSSPYMDFVKQDFKQPSFEDQTPVDKKPAPPAPRVNLLGAAAALEGSKSARKTQTKAHVLPCPPDVSEGVFMDFLAARKEKRAAVTATVIAGQRREAEKAGVTLEIALAYACEQGWQAFNAAWYADRTTSRAPASAGRRAPAPENFAERQYVGGRL